jgi:phage terminase large subunit-like protein
MNVKEAVDGAYFHFPSNANPYFPPEEWERARQRLPRDIFQQEYEAAFLSDAASVFRNVRNCIADTYEEPRPNHRYVMGLDLAKFGDFTVMTVVDRDSHKVVFWDRFTKLPYTLQKERILNIARKYHSLVVIDAMNVGAAMADELRAEQLSVQDFKAVGTISKDIDKQGSKEKMVEKLSLFFEQRNIVIPPEQVLIDELESFSYHLTASGNLVYGAPEGYHDDCVTSLGLAIMPLTGQRRTENIKVSRSMPIKKKFFQYL